ncbi:MAG: integron [Pseudomonadota bacterium]
MKRFAALCLAAVIAAGPAIAQSVAVTVGHDGPGADACAGYGTPQGLNPRGDNFLAVRSGPGTKYRMVDKLLTGDGFWVCSQQGAWLGIVYGAEDCGVGAPLRVGPYRGPCQMGWVHGRFVSIIAG